MPTIDYDVMIRDRAYEIWERAGQPLGLEHEHWAQARLEIEREASTVAAKAQAIAPESPSPTNSSPEPVEALRMRQALYSPEPFSFELFGTECPTIDLPIVLKESRAKAKGVVRAAA